MIPLLEEMFSDYEDDTMNQDTMPLIYNDNEEWEKIPNSNEIPSDYSSSVPSRNAIATSTSSLLSSVFSNFFNKTNTK